MKTAKDKALENIEKVHNKYKDHKDVEKAERWWKSKSKMAQIIIGIAVVFVGYQFFFGS